jgi:hypothetical protein
VRTQTARAGSSKRPVIELSDDDEDDEDVVVVPDRSKGKGKATAKVATGKAVDRKERAGLHRRLDGLQARLLQTVAEMNEVRLELAALDEE